MTNEQTCRANPKAQDENRGTGRGHGRGFTLIEVLITVGIIVLLTGLALGGLAIARKKATEARIRADLGAIDMALQAYASDFNGQYPVFADASTDQGSGSANNGQWLDYYPNRGAVLLCRALIGPGPGFTGTIAGGTVTPSPGDDGADGPGFRVRVAYNGTALSGGKVYGPYLDGSKFKIGYTPQGGSTVSSTPTDWPVMLDINGNPILYYPAAAGNPPKNLDYLVPKTTTVNATSRFNQYDNNAFFPNPGDFLTLAANCGNPQYLLWTCGLDGIFGFDAKGKTDDITNFNFPSSK